MGCIYKKWMTRPLPPNAELVERRGEMLALWQTAQGKTRTAKVIIGRDGSKRISQQAKAYTARYRDANGRMRDVPTHCRDKAAAMQILAKFETEAEKVRAGILSPEEVETSKHADRPIADHLEAYLEYLSLKRVRGRTVSQHYRRNLRSRMERLIRDCRFRRLADITEIKVRQWLAKGEKAGLAPATRNEYLISAKSFCNWAVGTNRLPANPIAKVEKAEAKSDARRKRRALTVEEVRRLLEAARKRPVAEHGRERVKHVTQGGGRRGGWSMAPLTQESLEVAYKRGCAVLSEKPNHLAKKIRRGVERALFYLVAVTTGLRKGELTSLKIAQVHLDPSGPYIDLLAKNSKSGKGTKIPIREDVADRLHCFIGDNLGEKGVSQQLFPNPPSIRTFDKDLFAAGLATLDGDGEIVKTDSRGRILDIHALRHTFATHLSLAGVPPRVAQAALRHSRIELTMETYTDPALLDVGQAVAALPEY